MSRFRILAVAALSIFALAMSLVPAGAVQLVSSSADYFAPQLLTVDTPTRADKDHLLALGLDATEHAGHDYIEVVVYASEELELLAGEGFTWDVRIEDMIAREVERQQLDAEFAALNAATDLPSGRNAYRVLGDFGAEIDALATANPDLAKRISIGKSVEGRDLTGIEIGVDVTAPEDGRPVFLMFGAHHAREWPSAEAPMEFAYTLINGFNDAADANHDRIVDLLSRGRVLIVPVSNPDGYDASRTTGDIVDLNGVVPMSLYNPATIIATPGNAYKRKNCRYVDGQTHPAGTCAAVASPGGLGVGIDLNRNYGALWGGPGASGDVTSALYRGPAPFSEPETQAIRNLISTRQVTTLITNHTFSNLLLRPVGVQPATIVPDGSPAGYAPDECFTHTHGHDYGMQALGERMSAQVGYSNQFGWELYDTTGTTEDYSYNATGGYGYTFEIGPDEFHPPYENVVNEYTGDTGPAQSVYRDEEGTVRVGDQFNFSEDRAGDPTSITSDAGDECAGSDDHPDGDEFGGGLEESYLIALENAVDAGTHSVLTGTAPAGTEITVERSGTFPLWDGTDFSDTVTTTMTVGDSGTFSYHVNPSTRPFVDSRNAKQFGAPNAEVSATGIAPATFGFAAAQTHTITVTDEVDLIRGSVEVTNPVDGQVVSYAQMHISLLDPQGRTLVTANGFGPFNSFLYTDPDGEKLEPGAYRLRITNQLAATAQYQVKALAQDVIGEETTRTDEFWTVDCGGVTSTVLVDRGQALNIDC